MGPLDLLIHLLNFLAPALFMGLSMALLTRVLMRKAAQPLGLLMQFAINSVVGAVVLLAGLWFFGRDGKMATYAVLVAGVAASQWFSGRHWR